MIVLKFAKTALISNTVIYTLSLCVCPCCTWICPAYVNVLQRCVKFYHIVERDKYGTTPFRGKLRMPFHRLPYFMFFTFMMLLDRAQLDVFSVNVSYFSNLSLSPVKPMKIEPKKHFAKLCEWIRNFPWEPPGVFMGHHKLTCWCRG